MSKKKSVAKKSVKKKTVKKKVVKKKVKVKAVNMSKDISILTEAVAALVKTVSGIVETLNTNASPKIETVPIGINITDKQAELFPTDDATTQDSEFTKENVTQALQKVSASVGMPKVKEVLKKFKAERVSDIQEIDYKAFIGECDTLVFAQA